MKPAQISCLWSSNNILRAERARATWQPQVAQHTQKQKCRKDIGRTRPSLLSFPTIDCTIAIETTTGREGCNK
eukprot:scaffold257384_cov47-Attheya_sp.AAC.1